MDRIKYVVKFVGAAVMAMLFGPALRVGPASR
jgi:hypothetical protein